MSNVSYSEMVTHRTCPQKWMYGYHFGIRPDDDDQPKPERDFGSWWSVISAADALERGRVADSLIHEPRKWSAIDGVEFDQASVTVNEALDECERWWKGRSEEYKAEFIDRMGEETPARLLGAYERWRDEHEEQRKTERPLAVEFGWGRDLPTPADPDEWAEWDRLMVDVQPRLVGYSDEIYEDTEKNMVVLRDGKTSKSLRTVTDDLLDSQLALNAWGASPKLKEAGVGGIRAVEFDRVRSVKPTEPKLNKSGTLSKQVTQYDLRTYLDWVDRGQHFEGSARDGSKAGIYEADPEIVAALSTPAWRANFIQRDRMPLSMNAVRAHLQAAVDTAADIARSRARVQKRGEAPRNLGPACKWCDYAKLCRAQMIGGPEGEYHLDEYGLKTSDGRVSIEFVQRTA